MKTDDDILRQIGPQIKLLKRHVQEWAALLKLQNDVLRSTSEEVNRLRSSHPDCKLVTIQLTTEKANRLTQSSIRQSIERQEMKARHYQEVTELEQVLNARE